MTVRIFRYEVPVDYKPHNFQLHGDPLAVGCRDLGVVEFWAAHHDGHSGRLRSFVVVGTGQALPQTGPGRSHWGTAVAPGGALVWHLIEVPAVPHD